MSSRQLLSDGGGGGSSSNSNDVTSVEIIDDDVRLFRLLSLGDVRLCFGPLTDVVVHESCDSGHESRFMSSDPLSR